MGRAECVVDVLLGGSRQLAGEIKIVLHLPGMEPQVFQQQDLSRSERVHGPLDRRPQAIPDETNRTSQQRRETAGHRLQRQRRVTHTLGPAQVGRQHHSRALIDGDPEGRDRGPDPGVVRNPSGTDGHVVIDSEKERSSRQLQVLNRSLLRIHLDSP